MWQKLRDGRFKELLEISLTHSTILTGACPLVCHFPSVPLGAIRRSGQDWLHPTEANRSWGEPVLSESGEGGGKEFPRGCLAPRGKMNFHT